jgi:hypothetical protein
MLTLVALKVGHDVGLCRSTTIRNGCSGGAGGWEVLDELVEAIAMDALDTFVGAENLSFAPTVTPSNSDPFDAAIGRASLVTVRTSVRFTEAIREFLDDPVLGSLATREGELDPMYLHSGGGARLSPTDLLDRLFQSAYIELYCRGIPAERQVYAAMVVDRLDCMRRAAIGEPIPIPQVVRFTGANLPANATLPTPWGTVINAPAFNQDWMAMGTATVTQIAYTSLLLIGAVDEVVIINRDNVPLVPANPKVDSYRERVGLLLPLAFALSHLAEPRVVPQVHGYVSVSPFSIGMTYTLPSPLSSWAWARTVMQQRLQDIHDWSRTLNSHHSSELDVAAHRTVSAVARRWDASDVLIDAVTAWENICGTKSETVFRVTGALAKLIEPDRARRLDLRKSLNNLYTRRSEVVHGETLPFPVIHEASRSAIEVALRSLAEIYGHRTDLIHMDATRRADALLLLSD